jgi:hypothetical protein
VTLNDNLKNHIDGVANPMSDGYAPNEIWDFEYGIRAIRHKDRDKNQPDDFKIDFYLLILSLRIVKSANIFTKFSYVEPSNIKTFITSIGVWHYETSRLSRVSLEDSIIDLTRTKAPSLCGCFGRQDSG